MSHRRALKTYNGSLCAMSESKAERLMNTMMNGMTNFKYLQRMLVPVVVVFFLTVIGCGKDPVDPVDTSCQPGEQIACDCPGGLGGHQLCGEEGVYGQCVCEDIVADVGWPEDVFVGEDASAGDNLCGGLTRLAGEPGQVCGDCDEGRYVCDGPERLRCEGAIAQNACGQCTRLAHAVGDLCGPCGQGRWQCDVDGGLVCAGDVELNECGGCSDLSSRRNFLCEFAGQEGTWQCANTEQLLCSGIGRNTCGGTAPLAGVPGQSCGRCDLGRWICSGPEAVVCDGADKGVNACGGCAPLAESLGAPCGQCDGQWQCDGVDRLACSLAPSLCGSCQVLGAAPGQTCGAEQVFACQPAGNVACVDALGVNPCGGTSELEGNPGEACGPCGEGQWICGSSEFVYCFGSVGRANACGGCGTLWGTPGAACGLEQVWTCDDSGEGIECEAEDQGPIELNACGGTLPLAAEPDASCQDCGQWACSSIDPNRLVCLGGSSGLNRDPINCGVCGRRCSGAQVCVEGDCVDDRAIAIDAGNQHTCALMQSGRVLCWGSGANGRLGHGLLTPSSLPVEVVGLVDAVEISAGSDFTCAVRATGDVACWGANRYKQLGLASINPAAGFASADYAAAPINVPALYGVRSIESGNGFSCGINGEERVVCWGQNNIGQLGRGTTSDYALPGEVLQLRGAVDVTVGGARTACAVRGDGTAWCWGEGVSGRLGNNADANSSRPVQVWNILDAVAIAGNTQANCAILANEEVWCWGNGGNSAIPDGFSGWFGGNTIYRTPTKGVDIEGALALTGGPRVQFFLRETSGTLKVWGNGGFGALMLGTSTNHRAPQIVEYFEGLEVIDAAIGERHSCVLVSTGQVYCAGMGSDTTSAWRDVRLLADNQLPMAIRRLFPTPAVGLGPVLREAGLCRDGLDNDGNGAADCADSDCATDLGDGFNLEIEGTLDGSEGNYFEGSCGASDGRERVYTWTAPATRDYVMTTEGSVLNTVLYVLSTCDASVEDAELACSAYVDAENPARLTLSATQGERYVVVVDSAVGAALTGYRLVIEEAP